MSGVANTGFLNTSVTVQAEKINAVLPVTVQIASSDGGPPLRMADGSSPSRVAVGQLAGRIATRVEW